MPCCAILSCRIRSDELKTAPGVVAFHRFPPDPQLKEKWIQTTGRKDWIPTKSSTICSKHFMESDYMPMNSKRRYLMPGAIPTQEINCLMTQTESEEYQSPSETPRTSPFSSPCKKKLVSKKRQETVLPSSNISTQQNRRVQNIIVTKESVIKKQRRQIRALQARNRRLKKKNDKLEAVLKELEDKYHFRREEVAI